MAAVPSQELGATAWVAASTDCTSIQTSGGQVSRASRTLSVHERQREREREKTPKKKERKRKRKIKRRSDLKAVFRRG